MCDEVVHIKKGKDSHGNKNKIGFISDVISPETGWEVWFGCDLLHINK